MSDKSDVRYVIQARLLGLDDSNNKKRRSSEKEFAIEVKLSDESHYVIFRTVKEITRFHTKLLSQFPVEAGYFDKKEVIIPDCPLKMTIFGPSRVVREDRVFEKLLNSYIKELPGMPPSIVKCEHLNKFFKLRQSDLSEPGKQESSGPKRRRKSAPIVVTEDSKITGPMRLRSYYAVAAYNDSKTKFSFAEGAVIQVLKKDASGWWMVDASGAIGWAPASFLVPVDEEDLAEEAKENERLLCSMRVGARYISMSAYQASRDDEISFVSGAVVKLIKKYADGWWLVRYNGGEGFVPGSMFRKFDRRQGTAYVKNIRRKFHNRKSTRIIPTMKPKWMTDPTSAPGASGLMLYQCLTRYRGSDSSEISLNKNDIVKVLDKKDHGWWYVEDRHGRSGWAPATYLGPVVDRAKKDSNPRKSDVIGSTHEVREPYTAQQKDELSVTKGDKVTVLSAPDDGWWVVCNMSSMEQGLIPSVCLSQAAAPTKEGEEPPSEVLESIKELSKVLEEEEDEDELVNDEDEDPELNNSESGSYESDEFGDDIMLDANSYVAITDYTKQAQDELSVSKGQVVYVVDDSDTSMFYVIVDGKEGWIPSDILRISSRRSSVSSSYSRPSRSRSVSPSPMHSRSPSPMDMSEMDQSDRSRKISTPAPSSQFPKEPKPRKVSAPAVSNYLLPSPQPSPAHRTQSLTTQEEVDEASNASSVVQINVENHTPEDSSLEAIEQAALEAERLAQEAQRKAAELREKAQKAKRLSNASTISGSAKDDGD